MEAAMLFVLLLLFIFLSIPIGIAIGVATLVAIIFFAPSIPLDILVQKGFYGVDSFPLLAVPFFILAGNLMSTGGIAKRLVDFAYCCVGAVTGGLAMVTTITCMIFAAISGSAVATTSAIGSFMIPEMERKNYNRAFSASLAACAGVIGIIIPPSIPLVIYGVIAQCSIGDLFITGIIPGILFGASLMLTSYFISKKEGYVGTGKFPTLKELGKSFISSFWALMAPVVILGGIYLGVFTPTEAAVVAVVYAAVVGGLVYKELNFKAFYQSFFDTMVINGQVMFMIGLSMAFTNYLSLEQVPRAIATGLINLTDNPFLLLLLINLFLIVVGCLIDIIPAIIILAPILLPVVTNLGMSPIIFGVMLVANLAIGFATPPYGPNLFVAAAVADIKMGTMMKYVKWFVPAMFVALMLWCYIPFVYRMLAG